MPCGCFLVLAAFFLVIAGGQGLRESFAFQKPVPIACQDFAKSPPQEGWFRVTGCAMSMEEAVYSAWVSKSGEERKDEDGDPSISAVYLPVHCMPQPNAPPTKEAPIALVVTTKDESIIATLKQMQHLDIMKPEEAKKWINENEHRFVLQKDVVGMVQAGINLDESDRKKIAELHGTMAPNYVIMDENKKPSLGGSFGMLIGGIVLGIVSLLYWANIFFNRSKQAI